MSIFEEIDEQINQNKNFWTDIDLPISNLKDPIQYQSEVSLKSVSGVLKTRQLVLSNPSIYICDKSQQKIKKKSIVLWKTVTAFEERSTKTSNCNTYVLRIGKKISQEFIFESSEILDSWLYFLSKVCIMTDFESDFVIIREIGYGNYASVFLAVEVYSLNEYAIKVISKEKILTSMRGVESIIAEIQIMRQLNHPALLNLLKVYENNEEIIMILDYIPGGNLNNRIVKLSKISENKALKIIKTLLEVCEYMHSLNIVHRDIKPDNILLSSLNDLDNIKLADFGLSCYISETNSIRCGSPGYIAPEILSDKVYNNKCDIYSIGIVLYILICGHSPFQGNTTSVVMKKNRLGEIYFNKDEWRFASKECIDFVLLLTRSNPDTRPSASEALKHCWFDYIHRSNLIIPNNPVLAQFDLKFSNKKISSRLMERIEQLQINEQPKCTELIKIKTAQANRVTAKLRDLEI